MDGCFVMELCKLLPTVQVGQNHETNIITLVLSKPIAFDTAIQKVLKDYDWVLRVQNKRITCEKRTSAAISDIIIKEPMEPSLFRVASVEEKNWKTCIRYAYVDGVYNSDILNLVLLKQRVFKIMIGHDRLEIYMGRLDDTNTALARHIRIHGKPVQGKYKPSLNVKSRMGMKYRKSTVGRLFGFF